MSNNEKNKAPITAGEVGSAGCGLLAALGCFVPLFIIAAMFLWGLLFGR